jgi:two-component system LytT family sensor kinase
MMTYKYESLRSQINPHFLFNSFNVLSELVYEDQKLAVQFIGKLSNVYRYVLDSRNVELVALKDELDFAKTFVFLMEIRFGSSLKVVFDIEPKNDEVVVPMSLQLLIENAVKHNEVAKNNPLKVTISRTGSMMEIGNVIKSKASGEDSKGIGLENIQSRYAYFTDTPVEIIQNDKFIVRIPILTKGT